MMLDARWQLWPCKVQPSPRSHTFTLTLQYRAVISMQPRACSALTRAAALLWGPDGSYALAQLVAAPGALPEATCCWLSVKAVFLQIYAENPHFVTKCKQAIILAYVLQRDMEKFTKDAALCSSKFSTCLRPGSGACAGTESPAEILCASTKFIH